MTNRGMTRNDDFENEIYQKLTEAQVESRTNPRRLSHDEVFGPLRQKIAKYEGYSTNAH
jgi:hypothetical protein